MSELMNEFQSKKEEEIMIDTGENFIEEQINSKTDKISKKRHELRTI